MNATISTNYDLLDLLTVLYQGSIQHSPLALQPVQPVYQKGYENSASFFHEDDIPTLAEDLNLPLPSNVSVTLARGLSQGVFQRSIQNGTQCGANVCQGTTSLPVLIYAYNPNMLRVNPKNAQLLALGGASAKISNVIGSVVRWSNNTAPLYGTRGSANWERSTYKPYKSTSSKCCQG